MHWLLKSDEAAYPFAQLLAERRTEWTGVRNFEARNNLRAMRRGDLALFYESGRPKAVVGVARVTREARPDPSAKKGEGWVSVEVAPVIAFTRPVTLAQIRRTRGLASIALVRRSRLSVAPLTPREFQTVLALSGSALGERPEERQTP